MAFYDFRPHESMGGGAQQNRSFALGAASTFGPGEPVRVNNAGTLLESGDDPTVDLVIGVANDTGDTVGASSGRFAATTYPSAAADSLPNTNDLVSVCLGVPGQLFATENFATDGAGTAATPLGTHIGDEAGITLAGGVYSIDIGTANNVVRIVDVLDNRGRSVLNSGGTGVTVVFTFVQTQLIDATAPAA